MKIFGGSAQDVTPPEFRGPYLSVSMSEPAGGTVAWRLDVFVVLPEGRYVLGTINTTPSTSGGPASRIVLVAHCPGAVSWAVTAFAPSGAEADITLATDAIGTATPGVTKIN
jgi:hypothetical protein